ncbi:MAG: hypothetical protein ACE5HD_08760 [Acidobacteriota bacterium]
MTRTGRTVAFLIPFLAALAGGGCGSSFTPTPLETTGQPAEPLGPVFDLEISLPQLFVPEAGSRGLELELRLDLEAAGPGQHAARYTVEGATAGMNRMVEVTDLGDGSTSILVTGETWRSDRIGPLKVGTMAFEMLLDGAPEDGGRHVSGEALESQTNLGGPFTGWSRHRFLVAASEFANAGRITEVALIKEREIRVREILVEVSGDPAVRRTRRAVFVLNRFTFDNIQRLDPDRDFSTTWQAGMGAGSNPHDILLLEDGRAYVTRYEPPFNDLAVIDAASGEILSTIPLAGLAENRDGTPRADRLAAAGGAVFAGLQDIDRTFTRFAEGKLAVIDPLRDQVVGVVPLGGKNPGAMDVLMGEDGRLRIYVALAGIFPGLQPQELSGGVAVVDVANRAFERLALDDDDAGGNLGALAMVSERLGYVVRTDAALENSVLAFDPEAGTVRRTVVQSSDFIPEIEADHGGVLAVPDRAFLTPRLCLYRIPADPGAAETLVGCGDLEVSPFSLEALD